MKAPPSITGRLTMTLAFSTALVFLLAGLAIVIFQSAELRRHQAYDLKTRTDMIASIVKIADRPAWFKAVEDKLISFTPPDDALRFIIQSQNPTYTFGQAWPASADQTAQSYGVYDVKFGDRTFMAMDRVVPAAGDRPAVVLTVAVDLAPVEATQRILGASVFLVSLASVVALTLLGRRAVLHGLSPVERLSAHAAALNPADLTLRLPDNGMPRELEGLTGAFNGALSRLEDAYMRLAAFNADVAHELRTPLTNIIGQTQVALSRPRAGAELEEVLHSNLEDLERLRAIINDMLFLARADQGEIGGTLTMLSLAQIVRKTADFMDPVLDDAGVSLKIEGDAIAPVEPKLLGRALTNLIDNAVRHGARPGGITVTIEQKDASASIAVRNRGGPIAPHQLDRLFDRFYRPDPSRERSGEVHGLGLAIVKAIALMHRGEVFARSEGEDVVVGIVLKAEKPA